MKTKYYLFALLLFIGIIISTYFIFTKNKMKEKELMVIKEQETLLPYIQNTTAYKEEYKSAYKEIFYNDFPTFFKEVNIFLNQSYTPDEINHIYTYLSRSNIEKLLDYDKVNLERYYAIPNFEIDKIDRYEEYEKEKNCSLSQAVLYVNIGLDHAFYTQIVEIDNKEDYTVLVNKYRSLNTYEPTDLVPLSYDEKYQLRKEARDAFEQLVSFGKLNNVFIRPYSAYRSYTYQQSIYNTYVNKDGQEMADTYSARPGHSEHQTGLAVDVWSEGFQEILESDANWLKENAYKYGFIVRYTKETEPITGYIEEPWHLRYLGVDLATKVYESNLTYDEYYDLYLK